MHNNLSATWEENSLPCCNKCGHLELKDVMGEGMEMAPSSATGVDGPPQSSGIPSGIRSCNCTLNYFFFFYFSFHTSKSFDQFDRNLCYLF